MTYISTDYLSLDFDTIKEQIIESLQDTETFKDYNFEGSNISVLIELISYLGDLNTFYLNQIAKNLYIDTADIYENVHRLAQLSGYTPRGYIASSTDLTIMLSQNTAGTYFSLGDDIYVPRFTNFKATIDETDINFVSTNNTYSDVTLDFVEGGTSDLTYFEFDVPIKQGEIVEYEYAKSDIFNNKITLPFYEFDNSEASTTESSA
jgi:hypothetical protein